MNKNGLATTLLLLPILLLAMFGLSVYSESKSYRQARQTVHMIQIGEGEGSVCSGVSVAPNRVLTAFHCTGDPKKQSEEYPVKITVEGKPAKVIRIDEEHDLSLLEVAIDCPCAPLGSESPDLDVQVIAVGWPMGIAEVVTEGRSQGFIESDKPGKPFLLSTTSIVFGNSGGGLFTFNWLSLRWELVGITVKIPGVSLGLIGIPVFQLTRSTPIEDIRQFLLRR